jgi:acetylornithine deacetylase
MSLSASRYPAYIQRKRDEWIHLLQQLIQISSLHEHEHTMTARIIEYLAEIGCGEVYKINHAPEIVGKLPSALQPISNVADRNSIVAIVRGTGSGKSLVLNAHLDIASVGDETEWIHSPFSGHIDLETRTIHGRGAMDDKAGVVICLALVESLLHCRSELKGDILIHLVLEDEITGNGSLLCLDAGFRADAAVIIDGTRLDTAIRQHAGQLQFQIDLKGKPASVSVSHLAVNAAEMIASLGMFLKGAIHSLNQTRPSEWLCFPSPYQCSMQTIQSTSTIFTVPETATASFFVTFCPPHDLRTMKEFIQAKVEEFSTKHTLPFRPVVLWNGYAVEPANSNCVSLEKAIAAAARQAGLPNIQIGPSTGTSDMRHYVNSGIPCVLYGPGRGFNAHRANEYYSLDDIEQMVHFYLSLAEIWCGSDDLP